MKNVVKGFWNILKGIADFVVDTLLDAFEAILAPFKAIGGLASKIFGWLNKGTEKQPAKTIKPPVMKSMLSPTSQAVENTSQVVTEKLQNIKIHLQIDTDRNNNSIANYQCRTNYTVIKIASKFKRIIRASI